VRSYGLPSLKNKTTPASAPQQFAKTTSAMKDLPNQPRKRRSIRIRAVWLLLLLPLYLVSYAILSFMGGWMVTESGRWRPSGLAEIDSIQWQPRFGFCQRFIWSGGRPGIRADTLGYIYCPLILIDQARIHPTIPLWRLPGDPDSGFDSSRVPPITQWHPTVVNPFAGRFPYESSKPKPN
jgi:hypothetical protein